MAMLSFLNLLMKLHSFHEGILLTLQFHYTVSKFLHILFLKALQKSSAIFFFQLCFKFLLLGGLAEESWEIHSFAKVKLVISQGNVKGIQYWSLEHECQWRLVARYIPQVLLLDWSTNLKSCNQSFPYWLTHFNFCFVLTEV